MALGTVLLADDEEVFRESTANLLRCKGYDCQCAEDADTAIEHLQHGHYDVLVSDIRMPCNNDMRIVEEARRVDSHLPIILVTGFPSAESAIRAISMSVDSYMTKPLDIEELYANVGKALDRSRGRRRLSAVVERLSTVVADLNAENANLLSSSDAKSESALATIRTLACCLSDLLVLWEKPANAHGMRNLCELLDCPQRPRHRQSILHAIEVLEKTKDSFKSKQLGDLRAKLEHSIGIER